MFASLKNRMTRSLVIGFMPATLGLVLISSSFAQSDLRRDHTQDPGPGGSGYCLATHSNDLPADDGPGLGGGYGPSGNPNPNALDGPGGSVPYTID